MRVDVSWDQVLSAFELVKDDPNFAASHARVAEGKMPSEMMQAIALRPEILQTMASLGGSVFPGGILERSLQEAVILESSRLNACQFCTNAHIYNMRTLGIAADPIAYIDNQESLPKREQLALAYTRAAMQDSNRIPDSLFAELKEEFSDPEIVQLTFLIGLINLLNLFNNCLQITYPTQ